jgi:hypothetical protein
MSLLTSDGAFDRRAVMRQPHATHWTMVRELWLNLGDGANQAADFFSDATSRPLLNVTPLTTFGN